MSHSQFRCSILNWHMHGLIFKTSICNWQDQPGYYPQNCALILLLESFRTRTRSLNSVQKVGSLLKRILQELTRFNRSAKRLLVKATFDIDPASF
jgi:hypothetical protein